MDRDLLASCPADRRDRWRSTALRVGKSKKAAIRIKCLECCCWQEAEVRRCQIRDCALWGLGGQDVTLGVEIGMTEGVGSC